MAINFLSGIDVDNGVLYTDTANNRVGVNQTSPIGAVHIVGPNTNAAMTTSALVVEQSDGAKILIDGNDIDAASGMLYLNDYSTNDVVFGGQIRVGGGGSPVGNSWFANGNVGIGTTSPGAKLHVSGGAIRIDDSQQLQFGNGNVRINNDSSGRMYLRAPLAYYFEGNGGYKMVLDGNSGNLGIGTTSPGAKLDVVSGDIRLGTNATYFRVRDTASAQPRVLGMNASNNFYIGPIDSYAGGAMAYGVSGNVTYHGFYGGGGEKVRITSAGKIGIGLTAPQTALQLYGTADDTTVGGAHRTAIRLTSTYASTFGGGGELQFGLAPSTAGRDALSVIKGSYSAFSSGNYGGDLEFHTRDADGLGLKQRMTVAHDGNVGIGTTNPGKLLELSGGANAACIRLRDTTSNVWDIQNSTLGKLDFIRGGTNTYMRIDQFGNVGIGTTSPSGRLTIGSGATTDNSTMFNVNGQYNDVGFNGGTSGLLTQGVWSFINSATWDQTRFYVQDQNNVASRLTFDFRGNAGNTNILAGTSTGNVGVGTTNPQRKFHVNGIARIEANGQTLDLVGTDHSYIGFYPDGVSAGRKAYIGFPGSIINRLTISNEFDDDISFFTNGSEKVTIENSGNVGIGTTSPALKLEVEGGDALLQLSTASSTGNPYMTFSQAGTRRSFIQHRDSGDNLKIASEYGSISLFTGTGGTETERITILSGGNVGIGTTSPTSRLHVAQQLASPALPMVRFNATRTSSTYGAVNVRVDNVDYGTGMRFYRSGIYDSNAVSFYNGASPVGSINISTSSTSYNTTSDYRLKENLTEITDGIDRIKQLKPKRFNFIGDTSVVDGFIAHEAKQVVPEAVTGEKDEVLPNGDPVYQGIDQAKIVPLLTAALQEAITKIEVLENRLQILENK